MAGWLETIKSAGTNLLKDNAGSIAAGVAGAILGSGKNDAGGSTTVSTTSVPAWMSDYAKQLMTQANLVAAQPYAQYEGPRVAGQTQDQQDAANMIRGNAGQVGAVIGDAMGRLDPNAGQGMLTQAGQYMQNAGGSWLDNSGRFMDDYTSNVTNPAVTQAMRAWDEQINPGIKSDFAGAKGVGAFGSDAMLRHTLASGERLTQQLGENMAAYLDKGYSGGMNQFNAEQGRQGQLAQIAAQLAQQQQTMNQSNVNTTADLAERWGAANAQDANLLNAIGQDQRNINQQAMDVDYDNWLGANNYDKEQLAFLQNMLQGNTNFADKTTTDNSSKTNYTSPLQAATQGYALYNAIKTGTQPKTGEG